MAKMGLFGENEYSSELASSPSVKHGDGSIMSLAFLTASGPGRSTITYGETN